jgi:hypothetical protein
LGFRKGEVWVVSLAGAAGFFSAGFFSAGLFSAGFLFASTGAFAFVVVPAAVEVLEGFNDDWLVFVVGALVCALEAGAGDLVDAEVGGSRGVVGVFGNFDGAGDLGKGLFPDDDCPAAVLEVVIAAGFFPARLGVGPVLAAPLTLASKGSDETAGASSTAVGSEDSAGDG